MVIFLVLRNQKKPGGTEEMVIQIPESIKQFTEKYLKNLGNAKADLLPLYMAGFLLSSGKRSYTALGTTVFLENRHKTAVGKFFRRKTFYSDTILKDLLRRLIAETLEITGMKKEWVLLIDGTCTSRGGFTKIGNALQYREKEPGKKGNSTKAHTFVMGLLIAPNDLRLPVRFSFYTDRYCEENGIPYKTQNDIALEIINYFRHVLPPITPLAVVADSYFDSKKIFEGIEQENTVFITSADRDRTHKLQYGTEKLHERGKNRKRRTFISTKGEEKYTGEYSRFSHPEMMGKMKQRYRITGEALNVSGIGRSRVVYSWKKKSRRKKSGESFRVLLCSDPSWSDEKIVEFYALRWQIEIFFRELKSDLGLCDFAGQDFESYERYIDVCLMAFVFLEWFRLLRIKEARTRKEVGRLKIMRTRGLKKKLSEEALKESFRLIRRQKLVA